MEINSEFISNVKNFLDEFENSISQKSDFINKNYIYNIENIKRNFEKTIDDARNNNRTLRIGIIGDVKAGKSSFLNALFFDGKDILPKAATPMTAALTKITYSKKPESVIHFYSNDDWKYIADKAKEYDEQLEEEYKKYCESSNSQNSGVEQPKNSQDVSLIERGLIKGKQMLSSAPLVLNQGKKAISKEKFKIIFDNDVSDKLISCKQLVEMANQHPEVLKKLDSVENVSATTTEELNDYVGATGKYTPIVSYIELKINNEEMMDLEIIDTPGLNDPITSRTNVTMDFLQKCDVAIILSPCTSFMPSSSVDLIMNKLPANGVDNIFVIGSKLDSGILDDNLSTSFITALKSSKEKYEESFHNTMSTIINNSSDQRIVSLSKDIEKNGVTFISSILFSISKKMEENKSLNDEEQLIMKNLCRWDDFKQICDNFESIRDFSQIDVVAEKILDLKDKKDEIVREKNDNIAKNILFKISELIASMITECEKNKEKLEKYDSKELVEHYNKINSLINLSEKQLNIVFKTAAANTKKSLARICARIRDEYMSYTKGVKIEKKEKRETEEYSHGFCGLFKDERGYNVKINIAQSSEAIGRLNGYVGRCDKVITEEYDNLFNAAELRKNVKKIILEPFSEKDDFNEMDIQLSLDLLEANITIPSRDAIRYDCSKYTNMIQAEFPGQVEGDKIGILQNKMVGYLLKIQNELIEIITGCADDIRKQLLEQSIQYSQQIKDSFISDLEMLKNQMNDRENSIASYNELIEEMENARKKLNTMKE